MPRALFIAIVALALLCGSASAQSVSRGLPGAPPPPPPSTLGRAAEQPHDLAIEICNHSGRNAMTAIVYQRSGQWIGSGWFRIGAGDCGTVAHTDNLTFYVFAEEEGNQSRRWVSGRFGQCVDRPGPYERPVNPSGDRCGYGQDLVPFQTYTSNTWGTFTWTLDP